MARPLRIELFGGLYHVTSRGDRREDIYFSEADREAWLALFAQVCARFNWICHAYCLMTNHYHLIIETPEGSSYPVMIGELPSPVWLQTDWILGQFSPERDQARLGYLDFVRAGVGLPSVWDDLKGQIYLGSEAFIERMQSNVSPGQSLDEIPRKQCRPPAKPLALYRADFADDPRTGMALAYLTGDYAMKVIADAFDVHYTTVSRAVRAYESKQDQK